MSIPESTLSVKAAPLPEPLPVVISKQTVTFLAVQSKQPSAADRFQSESKVVIRSEKTQAQMLAAANKVFGHQGNFLVATGESSATEFRQKLKKGQLTWNEKITTKLSLIERIEQKDGLISLTSKNLNEVQVRALVKPGSIHPELWDSIPNKHFESINRYEDDLNKTNLLDWSETKGRSSNSKAGFYQAIKDNFRNIKDLSVGQVKNILNEINSLEAQSWQKTFSEAELFGRPALPPNADYIEAPAVTVKLSNEQIQSLQEIKKNILADQIKGTNAFNQSWNLGEVLRTTKSVRDIMADPHYIKDKLLDPTKRVLEQALPEAIPFILYDLQKKIEVLLKDVCGLQESSLKNLKNNSQVEALDSTQRELVQGIIKSVLDRVVSGLESSSGRQITEAYARQIGNAKSPLGCLPGENSAQQKPELSEAYSKLEKLLKETAKGNSKLSFQSLLPIAAEIETHTSPNKTNLAESSRLAKPMGDLDQTLGLATVDRKAMSPPSTAIDQATLGAFAARVKADPVIEITDYTKAGFDEVFKEDKNFALLNLQLGFVPFETDPEKQKQLEVILTSPRFAHIFSEQTFEQDKKTIKITPALLSRTKYLYYQIIKSQSNERSKVLSETKL